MAIQMKSIMVIGTFISYDFMLGHTFRSIRTESSVYLNSSGYEVGFHCVEWCVEFVGTEVGVFLVLGICLVLVETPSYFLYFAKAFIYSRPSENTQIYLYSSCRIEIIFRFKLLNFS